MAEEESLRGKLARLRREPAPKNEPSGPGALEPSPAKPGIPAWLRARLAAKPAAGAAGDAGRVALPCTPKLADKLRDMTRAENRFGAYSVRERVHADSAQHGSWRLAAVDQAVPADIAFVARDPALSSLDLRQAVFLDVETTGLSGGAGTTSFMVALGRFEGAGFHLWQGFLEGPEEERAMLHEVAERVAASSCVVSFFGKSFDRHRLEDKMRLHHLEPPFEARPHLDLYHPLHRLYSRSLPNGKLATLEQTLCDVARADDLPGSFAPEAWFDYLGGRAHRLEAVFQHNADDVLSLVTLAAHLGRSCAETDSEGRELSGSAPSRALGLAQLWSQAGEPAKALEHYQAAMQRAPQLEGDRKAAFHAARWCKQTGELEAALERWSVVHGEHTDELACSALVESAMLWEHQRGGQEGWAQALELVRRGRELVKRMIGQRAMRLAADLEKRELRLVEKLRRVGAS